MRHELIITIAGREHAVTVDPRPGGAWRVCLEGREHLVDARRVRPGTWSLLIGDRSYVVDLDERARSTAVLAGELEAEVTVEDARRKRLAAAVSRGTTERRGEVVRAPIAGKVVKVLVAPGDQVEAGQSLAVLEAMKMENEIKCESGGTVEAIHVEAGQSVETQDQLITVV